jgi:hypothetical protein
MPYAARCRNWRPGSDVRVTSEATWKGETVKYLLILQMNPEVMDAMTEDERQAIYRGHADFIDTITKSGEMVTTHALADPSNSITVRRNPAGGPPTVTDGPYLESKEFMAGFYIVDCESRDRVVELTRMIPDSRHTGVEIRPIMSEGGAD